MKRKENIKTRTSRRVSGGVRLETFKKVIGERGGGNADERNTKRTR